MVTKRDGFYKDGSFIQHNTIPYTGSYGNVLIKGVGQILAITQGSSFEMNSAVIQAFVENVDQAFLPLIYQGEMLPLVNGRSISRAPARTKSRLWLVNNLQFTDRFAVRTFRLSKEIPRSCEILDQRESRLLLNKSS